MSDTPGQRHQSSRELYLRLLGYVRPYWRMFVIAIFGMVGTAAMEPVLPALMKPFLDGSFARKDLTYLYAIPVLLIGLFVLRGLLTYTSSYALARVSNRVVVDLRNAMFRRLVQLPTAYYNQQWSGKLISKITYDVGGVAGAATTVLTVSVRDTLTAAGLLGWLLYLNWQLTLITLVMIPLIALAIKAFSLRLRTVGREAQRAMGNITHILQEATEAHKVIKVFGGQDYETRRFDQASRDLYAANMRQTIAASATVPIVQFFAAVALSVVIALALIQSTEDKTTVGGFVSFITAMLMLLAPLKRLTDINATLQQGLAAAESVFEALDEKQEQDHGSHDIGRARGAIRLEGVTFRYPGTARLILDDVSIGIAPGEIVALVGASGGGKTTLANLIPHFFQPDSGRVLIDGYDLQTLSLASIRRNIALVSQDIVLFNDTVAANIAYGEMNGTAEVDICKAAEAAHALEFIREMPQGMRTLIGENGVRLSGGQRQRLAIARAILKNAPILILDEATSALDAASERLVYAALNELMKHRTTLVIAHRLSTVEKADKIVVLKNSRIVETGTHEELMAKGDVYAHFYRLHLTDDEVATSDV